MTRGSKASALALLGDRRQQAMSLLQDESGTTHGVALGGPGYFDLPATRIYFPFQGPTATLDLYVVATTTSTTTADIVRVHQVGVTNGAEVTFAADGTIQNHQLKLQLQDSGLGRYADVAVGAQVIGPPFTSTDVRAVSGYWTPGA